MKATDLMIEDWVHVKAIRSPFQRTRDFVGKINEVDGLNRMVGIDKSYFDYDELEPIPLTPEILEKNGFERRKETRVDCYDLRQDKASVYLEIKDRIEHEWLCVIGRHYPTSWRCRLELRVHEVHELQHALRLCGIDKEVVL